MVGSATIGVEPIGRCVLKCGGQILKVRTKITEEGGGSRVETRQQCSTPNCEGIIPHNPRLDDDSIPGVDQAPQKFLDVEDTESGFQAHRGRRYDGEMNRLDPDPD